MFLKPKRILWRVFPVILGVSILTVATTAWYATQYFERIVYTRSKELLSRETLLLSTIAKPQLLSKNDAQLDYDIKKLSINARSRFSVIAPDGTVIADSQQPINKLDNHKDRPEIQPTLSGSLGMAVRYSRTTQSKGLYVARPVFSNGKVIGVVRASVSLDYVEQVIRRFYIEMIGACLFILAIVSVIGYLTYRWLAKPFETLRDGIERFSCGDLKHRLAIPTHSEMTDITNAVNAMASQLDERFQSLQNEQLEKETILTSLFDGIMVIDCEERVLNYNAIAATILGLKDSHAQGQKVASLIRNSALIDLIRKTLRLKSPHTQEIVFRSHQDAFYQVDCIPVKEPSFAIRKLLVVFHNITETKRIQSARRNMVMNVSNHLKLPITRIQDGLNDGFLANRDDIAADAKLMTTILNDLIYLIQFEDLVEQQQITFGSIHVETILADAQAILSTLAGDKIIHVNGQGQAIAHPESLMQVLLHLLKNAIAYSAPTGRIDVTVTNDDGQCIIEIKDTGIGIPAQDIPHIFKPFYRIDTPAHQQVKGGGLGLAIVKTVIDAHHGIITVDNTMGGGTTIRIKIPTLGGHHVLST